MHVSVETDSGTRGSRAAGRLFSRRGRRRFNGQGTRARRSRACGRPARARLSGRNRSRSDRRHLLGRRSGRQGSAGHARSGRARYRTSGKAGRPASGGADHQRKRRRLDVQRLAAGGHERAAADRRAVQWARASHRCHGIYGAAPRQLLRLETDRRGRQSRNGALPRSGFQRPHGVRSGARAAMRRSGRRTGRGRPQPGQSPLFERTCRAGSRNAGHRDGDEDA